jgi:hypothetical protein
MLVTIQYRTFCHPYCCLKTKKVRIYKTVILPMVLYGWETWSVIWRVFENRVLRRIFGPKRDAVTGGWREQDNEQFHNL